MPNENDTHTESSASADKATTTQPKPGYVFGMAEVLFLKTFSSSSTGS